MNIVFKIVVIYFIVFTSHNSFGQISDTSKMSNLVVYGDGFTFSVEEPIGWTGDIDIAKDYYSNIAFYQSKDDIKKGGALIQVYRFGKQDEKTEKDLEYDIKSYKDKYKNLKQQDFLVSHKDYKCYSKLVYVDNDFYQYIVYVNPGPKFRTGVSVAINISKRLATEEELQAFRQIISSLVMLKG
ncbi:MAG: hypothetical protein H7259_01550 [Cytophagales bacterium]|nr:hypothetical protein [Cytophaga sp.]